MPRRFVAHVERHPLRLAATSLAVLIASMGMLLFAINTRWEIAREGRIDNCIAINELSRKIYVSLAEAGVPLYEREKFRPTVDCSSIP